MSLSQLPTETARIASDLIAANPGWDTGAADRLLAQVAAEGVPQQPPPAPVEPPPDDEVGDEPDIEAVE